LSSTKAETQNKKKAATLIKSKEKDNIDKAVESLKEAGLDAKIIYRKKDGFSKKNKKDIELMHQQLRAMGVKD